MNATDPDLPYPLRLAGAMCRHLAELDATGQLVTDIGRATDELCRLHARVTELESQLDAVGAGGVGPLMAPQPDHCARHLNMVPADQRDWAQVMADLYAAALRTPHNIDDRRIVLHYDETQPGRNAANQLLKRLQAALPDPSITAQPKAEQNDAEILTSLLYRRPAMNAGQIAAYALWTAEVYRVTWALARKSANDTHGIGQERGEE